MNKYPSSMPPEGVSIRRYPAVRGYITVQWWLNGHPHQLLEHRYVWQLHFGLLPSGYVVHHIDENRSHNDIDNLRAMENAVHQRLHARWHGASVIDNTAYALQLYYRRRHITNPIRNDRRREWNRTHKGTPEWRERRDKANRAQLAYRHSKRQSF